MFNSNYLGVSPHLLSIRNDLNGNPIFDFQYDLPGEFPCTVETSLSLKEVSDFCYLLGIEGSDK